jgi:kynurenine formamidase
MAPEQERLTFEPVFEGDGCRVSRSPWGPDDEIGRLNWITPESRQRVLQRLNGSRTFDLSVSYTLDMPTFQAAGDMKYEIWMTHTPQGSINDNLSGAGAEAHKRASYCGDSIAMYTHTGTHMDMLTHLGYCGRFWNGWTPEEHLGSRHWLVGGPEKYPNIVARGVMLDIAGLHGVDCLPDRYVITPEDIRAAAGHHGVELHKGDVVCIRTGRMIKWPNADEYAVDSPGIGIAAARYLCEEAGAMCIGADNDSLEVMPAEDPSEFIPVHPYMFATAGAQIIESLWLEELAAEGVYEFAFIGGPLKLTGATGAPLRPMAIPLL